jgi:hypothetical protein
MTALLIVVSALAVAWLGVNTYRLIHEWLRGRRGLDQWPQPHGRYHRQWLRLGPGAGSYYEWLAAKMGNREPWAMWAAMERMLSRDNTYPGSGSV